MATYTIRALSMDVAADVNSKHILLGIYRNGVQVAHIVRTLNEILNSAVEIDNADALSLLLRIAIKASGATTLAQAKKAVESASWEV